MPLLARFIGTIATFFVEIFAKFLGYKAALADGSDHGLVSYPEATSVMAAATSASA